MTILFVFVFGAVIGSFLNAAIFRLHDGRSVVKGRSKCMTCEEPIGPMDLIPIVSFLLLRGRCRSCKNVISWQYPLVEFVLGLLFVLFYVKFAEGWFGVYLIQSIGGLYSLARAWIFIGFLAVLFVYDLRYMIIPDQFSLPAIIVALIVNLWIGIPASSLLLGMIVFGAFFYLQFVISQGTWVGGGDIRMGVLIGAMLGLTQGFVALFIAYFLGALVGVALLVSKRVQRKTQIPFGTFLTTGVLTVLFFGDAILQWYLSLFV